MNPIVAVVIVALVVVVAIVLVARSRRSRDGVDSFRRQIDALSPEARRPVVDQVQNAANRIETRPIDADADADADGDGDASDEAGAAGEPPETDGDDGPVGGARGT